MRGETETAAEGVRVDVYDPEGVVPVDERDVARSVFGRSFARLGDTVREARVVLSDENGPKGGLDKRCKAFVILRSGVRLVVSGKADHAVRAARMVAKASKQAALRAASVVKKSQK